MSENPPLIPPRALRRARLSRLLPYLVAGGVLACAILVLGDQAHRHIDALEAWIAGLGPWSVIVFILLYAFLNSLFVPDLLLGIIAGIVFGLGWGLAAVSAGTLAGAALQYALSRHLLKPRIDRYLQSRPVFAAMQSAVLGQELHLQFLIRLTPINRALTSYVLGAAGVGFARFTAALIAALPYLGIEVYAGIAGKQLATISAAPARALALNPHTLMLAAGLIVSVVVMALIGRIARRAVEAATVAAMRESGAHKTPGKV